MLNFPADRWHQNEDPIDPARKQNDHPNQLPEEGDWHCAYGANVSRGSRDNLLARSRLLRSAVQCRHSPECYKVSRMPGPIERSKVQYWQAEKPHIRHRLKKRSTPEFRRPLLQT